MEKARRSCHHAHFVHQSAASLNNYVMREERTLMCHSLIGHYRLILICVLAICCVVIATGCGQEDMVRQDIAPVEQPEAISDTEPVVVEPEEPAYETFNPSGAMEHIRTLSVDIGYRPGGTEAEHLATAYIKDSFRETGYENVHEQTFVLDNGLTSYNVYVEDKGSDPEWTVIIGAHYDSAGGTGSPGANDNASGIALVLELARIFKTNVNTPTLRFVAFGCEEILEDYGKDSHHYGSRYMANHLVDIEGNTIGMISIDMVGVGNTLYANATLKAPSTMTDIFMSSSQQANIPVVFRQDPGWSDHEAFEGHGISSVWVEYRDDPYYHSPQDSFDKVNSALVSQAGKLIQDFLEGLTPEDCQMLDSVSTYR